MKSNSRKILDFAKIMYSIYAYFKKYYFDLLILIVPITYVGIFNILLSKLIELGIDVSLLKVKGNLILVSILLIGCVFLYAIFYYFYRVYSAKLQNKIAFDIRTKIMKKSLVNTVSDIDKMESGKVLRVLFEDTNEASKIFSTVFFPAIIVIVSIIVGVIYIFSIAWQIGIIAIILLPIFYFINKYYSNAISYKYPIISEIEAKINMYAKELIENILIVKVFFVKKRLINKLEDLADEREKNVVKKELAIGKMKYITSGQIMLLQLISIIIGAILLKNQYISEGALLGVVNCLVGSVFYPLLDLPDVLVAKAYADAAFSRINVFEDTITTEVKNKISITNSKVKGAIVIENLKYSFQGADQNIINGIYLTVNIGEVVSILGESGCGKTTFAYLLLHLLQDYEGCIKVYKNTNDSLGNKRNPIGYMPQKCTFFPVTLADNIRLGCNDITNSMIEEALEAVDMLEIVKKLPMGLDTIIDSKITFSTGQEQRISFARTLLQSDEVIILDEPISALDKKSKELVIYAINKIKKTHAIIIISHDKEVLDISTKAYYLEGGILTNAQKI